MPSPGKRSDYEIEIERIREDISSLEKTALQLPVQSDKDACYVYRLYQRSSLTGDLRSLRDVETAIDRAIERVGPAEDLCLLKAQLDMKLHRMAEAKRDLAMSPTLPARIEAKVMFADMAFQEGRYEEARIGLQALVEEDRTWDKLAHLAHIEGKLGDPEKADQLYAEAEDELTAKEMKSYSWVQIQRGVLDLTRKKTADALAHYQAAERAFSGHWLTDEHIAGALVREGNLERAAEIYESVLLRNPKPEVMEKLGKVYRKLGRDEEAERLFTGALAAYMESVEHGEVHYYHHLTEFFAEVRFNRDEAVQWALKDISLRDNLTTRAALARAYATPAPPTALG